MAPYYKGRPVWVCVCVCACVCVCVCVKCSHVFTRYAAGLGVATTRRWARDFHRPRNHTHEPGLEPAPRPHDEVMWPLYYDNVGQ